MRISAARAFRFLIVLCLLCSPAPARAAQNPLAQEILKGRALPKDWADAPDELVLPANWVSSIDALVAETKATNHERGACVSYGRPMAIQEEISSRLVELGSLLLKADTLARKGDAAGAAKAGANAEAFRLKLEADARSEVGYDFEFQREVKGMSNSVHTPKCIGSQLGTMHTHPDRKGESVFFSHTDVAIGFYEALNQGQSLSLVSNEVDSMILVPTEEIKERWSPAQNGQSVSRPLLVKEYSDIRRMLYLLANSARSRKEITTLFASYMRRHGLVLYHGKPPVLKKVEPLTSFRNDLVWLDGGDVKPARTTISLLYALGKFLVHNPQRFNGPDYKSQVNELLDRIANTDDYEYLNLMGLNLSEIEIQFVANNDAEEYDLGACSKMHGAKLEFYPKCMGKSDFSTRRVKCAEIAPDNPALQIDLEPKEGAPFGAVFFRDESDPKKCAGVMYDLTPEGKLTGEQKKLSFTDRIAK